MILNVKVNYIKKYKYVIGSFLILFLCLIILYHYSRKKDIYILYDDFMNCNNVEEYQQERYLGMCYKHDVIFFEKNKKEKEYEIKDINKFKLISKDEFFKIDFKKFKKINLILIVKRDKGYEIIHVRPFKIIS